MPPRSRRIKRFPIIREHGVTAQLSTLVSLPVSTPAAHPVLRQPAPDFSLADHTGHIHRLHSYIARGKPIILSFYPLAGSPFCTKQLCSLRSMQQSAPAFSSAAVTILGISQDSPSRIAQFVDTHALTYPVLSDCDGSVHDKYGIKTFFLGLLNRMSFICSHYPLPSLTARLRFVFLTPSSPPCHGSCSVFASCRTHYLCH